MENVKILESYERRLFLVMFKKLGINSYSINQYRYEDSVTSELFDTWRNERKKVGIFYQYYKQTTLIPYAKELIELLHSKGFILGIMTNGTASMEYHKSLNALFAVLVNPENCGGSKPDLAPFTKVFFIVLNFIDR